MTAEPSIGLLVVWTLSEAALGIGIGLAVSFVLEGIGVAAQVMGLQAGYAFASTIDPNTQADSGILVVFSQLVASLLFFAMGLDREVLRIFAASLVTVPAGSFVLTGGRRALPGDGRGDVLDGSAPGPAGDRGAGDGGHFAGPVGPHQFPTAASSWWRFPSRCCWR